MASENQHDALISAVPPPNTTTTTTAPSPDPPPLDNPTTATPNPPKRQRRPSVRLGEIGGDPPYDAHQRRPSRTWRFHKDPSFAAKTSKTRPLTNLVNGGAAAAAASAAADSNVHDSVELSQNYVDFTQRKPKIKKPTKRVRTNWTKFDSSAINNNVGGGGGGSGGGGAGLIESTNLLQEEDDNNNDEFRDFEAEGSDSPMLKEQQSPINSGENMGLQFWDQQRRGNGVHLNNEVNSPEKQSEGNNVGVREWLLGLGLGRYAPVFEIHEVDDEVLPMLTLEDLKDMGVNAVGSRRKMYSAILKLRKGFS